MEKKIFFIDFDGTLIEMIKRFQIKIGKHCGMQWIRGIISPLRPAGLSAADGELQKNLD